MATLVSYAGDEPVTLAEVKLHCHIDHDAEDELVSNAIIPGARALGESKTGSAIRQGSFVETLLSGQPLSIGGVIEVTAVTVDGEPIAYEIERKARRTYIIASDAHDKPLDVEFTAGIDIAAFPGVKSWLLLTCGWMYAHREALTAGPNAFNEMPSRYVDTLLEPITLPNPF